VSSRLLVVFDLDGVIARTDTMAFLLQRQLLSHPLRAIAGAPPAVAWFVLHRFPRIRVRLSRALGRAALSGLSETQYGALATEVGTLLGSDPTKQIPAGVAAVRRHVHAGDEVVITTGTEGILSRAFLDAVGIDGVELIATELRFDRRLVRYEVHNLGPAKASRFPGRAIDLFYTDSQLDLEVARLSRRTVLVNPNRRLARLFAANVPGLQVESWE
jgi:phosphoserine phosphatase